MTSPERTALVADGRSLSYGELEAEAVRMARRLAGRGVRRDSTVAISLPAGVDHVVLLHALMKLGAVAFPVDPRFSEAERERAFASARPVLEIGDADELGGHEADLPLLGEVDLDTVHSRILTSGTSGSPEAVGLTYGNHLWSAVGSAFNLGVDPDDRWLCCLPLFHVSGLSIVLRSVIYGTTAVVQDGFDLERVAVALESGLINVVSLVSTTLSRLLEAGADISSPRVLLLGGGPVPQEILEEAVGRGATVAQTYGLTQAASQVTTLSPDDAERKLGSAGRPLLTTHVRIEDSEILVQGPTVAPGCADERGWLHTGDLGHIDADGFLWVQGRRDDLIVTGGENVSPEEVEEVLRKHPSVADVAVVARDDPARQQAVTAVIVLEDGDEADPDDLARHCAAALAPHKVPRRFEVAPELPRTPSGKVLRRELR
ncbi:MAG: o-succinylbenzoate--CoA ligase [Solirubrobacterales bacterium]|nr:o-succinylbenzoate--CoA ligase [Solirubrobacterales bacterium]